jgi:hypothetical protein
VHCRNVFFVVLLQFSVQGDVLVDRQRGPLGVPRDQSELCIHATCRMSS